MYNHGTDTQIIIKTFWLFLFIEYKNEWKYNIFRRQKNQKIDFYNNDNKKIFNLDDIDVNKILVCKKEQHGKYNSFKYFIGFNDNVIRPLCLKLLQMTGYINNFDENKNKNKNKNTITMTLKVKYRQLLKSYNKIWKKTQKINEYRF